VDADAADRAGNPAVRQRLGPPWIGDIARDVRVVVVGPCAARKSDAQCEQCCELPHLFLPWVGRNTVSPRLPTKDRVIDERRLSMEKQPEWKKRTPGAGPPARERGEEEERTRCCAGRRVHD